ncbi:MAG: glutathione S-transferase family protein [Novosphingobium sp.]
MADYTFYTNPMSRGQIVLVDWKAKPAALLAANPMGKVPALVHHAGDKNRVVTEAAAICLYLAEMHPEAELLPNDSEMADYYRWTFFAAGPVEQAITARNFRFEPSPEQEGMAGWGNFDRSVRALDGHLSHVEWICGDRFTMADVYVGSTVDWGLNFGILPPLPSFAAYAERCQARAAYKDAKAIDNALIADMKK